MIDVNVTLGRWAFRRLPCDETPALLRKLQGLGIVEAWAGSFDALLHEDVAGVNARLAAECAAHGSFFRPFGAINPRLPDWRDDLRRCMEVHAMPGIRLHPEFHGYGPADPNLVELLGLAEKLGLVVQIGWRIEDERTVSRHLQLSTWKPADVAALSGTIGRFPGLRIVILNALTDLRADPLASLVKSGKVAVDIARQEGAEGVRRLVDLVGIERIVFGTHAPFFVPEAAVLKLKEAELSKEEAGAIRSGNARRILGGLTGR